MMTKLLLLAASLLPMSNPPTPAEVLKPGHVIWTFPMNGKTYVELHLPNEGAKLVDNGERIPGGEPFGNAMVVSRSETSLELKNKAGTVYSLPLKEIALFKIKKRD